MVIGEADDAEIDDVDARADEALNRFLPADIGPGVPRSHHVTALVLAREGAQWLPRSLAALAAQSRPADEVIGIDAGSSDDSPGLLADSIPSTITVQPQGASDSRRGSGGVAWALAAGVARAGQHWPAVLLEDGAPGHVVSAPQGPSGSPESQAESMDAAAVDLGQQAIGWYWILHDDCAPHEDCLAALLAGADRNPASAVLVPKTVSWSDPGRLVGVGSRWAPGMPVVDPLEAKERDQGQYDVDRPVYAGDSAGMLVRADVWAALGGLDPDVGDWAGPADLCRRVWGSGWEVTFVPAAVVAHRQAGHRGARPGGDGSNPRRAARAGQLTLELSQAPRAALPWRYVRAWLSTALRLLALLLTREPEEATAELAGAWQVLGHPRAIRRVRRRARRAPVTSLARPPKVRARRGAALAHSVDSWTSASRGSPMRTWWPPPARFWRPLALAGLLAVAALVRDPGQVLGSGSLRGGGLLPAPGAMELLGDYLASWHDVRFGTGLPMPAYLPLLAAASVVTLGSVDLLLRAAFGLALPLAFLSCYLSLGPHAVVRHRILTSLAYACLPAGVAAMGGGRISTLAVLLLGPPSARLIVDAFARPGAGAIRAALAAGTMLGILVAFAPLVFLVVLLAAVVCWTGLGMPRRVLPTGLTILGVAAFFLLPWSPRLLTAPWLALSEVGINNPSLGDPQPWIWGLGPGGPTAVAWAGAPLLVLAVVAVLVARFSARSVGLLAGAAVLLAGAGWLQPWADRWWPDLPVGMLWPGVPLLLAGGLLVLLVAGVAARPGRAARALSVAWVASVAVLVLGWWVAPQDVAVGTGNGIPPVVGLDAESPARARSLVLGRTEGALRYAVATGPQAALGDADALAGVAVDPGFADAVSGLVSGASGAVERELGGRAIRYVVFDGPPEDPVVAELDATIGLRQLARAPEQSLWLVAGGPTRAELAATGGADGESAAEPIEVPVLTVPTSLDVVLHPETQLPRRLAVAEQADRGWAGSISGVPLELVPDPQGMLQASITIPGVLELEHQSTWPMVAVAQLVAFAGLVVLSLPKRRQVDPDAPEDIGGSS